MFFVVAINHGKQKDLPMKNSLPGTKPHQNQFTTINYNEGFISFDPNYDFLQNSRKKKRNINLITNIRELSRH